MLLVRPSWLLSPSLGHLLILPIFVKSGPNAGRTLRLLGDDFERAYLSQATHNGWPEMKNSWFEFRFGMGPREGEKVADVKNETGQSTVHRAKFLEAFVQLVCNRRIP